MFSQLKPSKDSETESSDSDVAVSLKNDTDTGSEFDEPSLSPGSPEISDINQEDWVAVSYECDVYPGLVTEKLASAVTVKCLERSQKYYRWPKKDDKMFYRSKMSKGSSENQNK